MNKIINIASGFLFFLVFIGLVFPYIQNYFSGDAKVSPPTEKESNSQTIANTSQSEANAKPITSLTPPAKPTSGKFKYSSKEAVKAAEDFEKLLFGANPKTKNLISYFDVSAKDGHLLVNVKQAMVPLKKYLQEAIFRSWEDTPTKIIARLLEMHGSKRAHNMEGSSNVTPYSRVLDNPPDGDLLNFTVQPRPIRSIKRPSDKLRDRTSSSFIVSKIILIVLAEESPGMVDPRRVVSETKRIMEANNLITEKDLEITPSGKTRLEKNIERLQRDFISEGLAESAEGMWLLTKDGLEDSAETKKNSRLITGKENDTNQLSTPKVTYRHARLCFLKDKIEGLEAEDAFRIICQDGIFQMTKSEFYEVFENIVTTISYRDEL